MERRRLLKLGLASGIAMAVAGGGVALWRPGLVQGRLAEGGRSLFRAVGNALLDGSLPYEDGARQIALNGLIERIDQLTLGLPPHAQAELSQLLALLDTAPGRLGMAGLRADWGGASLPAVQEALQMMRRSTSSLRLQTYHALHDIVGGAYFSSASTWSLLGYPGPMKI